MHVYCTYDTYFHDYHGNIIIIKSSLRAAASLKINTRLVSTSRIEIGRFDIRTRTRQYRLAT